MNQSRSPKLSAQPTSASWRLQQRLVEVFHSEIGLPQAYTPITSRLETPPAIVSKLTRGSTRLSQMQDIAGARIVLPGALEENLSLQNQGLEIVRLMFGDAVVRLVDGRDPPDELGYRPLHVILRLDGLFAEIQLRTVWQDAWAQAVEFLDAEMGTDLKHGNGLAESLGWLRDLSNALYAVDRGERLRFPTAPNVESSDE